jgi:quercetin dioxygenase-like cupin family protein
MKGYIWSHILREQMSPEFARQVIHAERITVAKVFILKGGVVSRHQHENEQITVMMEGRLKFIFDEGEKEIGAGEVLTITPNLPHSVEALEDSWAFDLFSPCRDDWKRGDDAYLRR